jgi:hypothetical protein
MPRQRVGVDAVHTTPAWVGTVDFGLTPAPAFGPDSFTAGSG